jgi:hypothetical protein
MNWCRSKRFLKTIKSIAEVHERKHGLSPAAFRRSEGPRVTSSAASGACITRRNQKIFEMLKDWRLEGSVIDQIEEDIRNLIDWFDAMNRVITAMAESLDVPVATFREIWGPRNPLFQNDWQGRGPFPQGSGDPSQSCQRRPRTRCSTKENGNQGQQPYPETHFGQCG